MHFLATFIVQNFKNMLSKSRIMRTYGQKWPISLKIFFLQKPTKPLTQKLPFIHLYLKSKNQSQMSIHS